ncbi:MAG: nickel pincer cofactor biosynthesis protein LarC [Acidimicrobiales bacterium]
MSPPEVVAPAAAPATTDTVAWFHCFSGIAGDMALAALVDAGADIDEVREMCARLPVTGWELEAADTMRNGIGATQIVVRVVESGVVRTYGHISAMVEEARLPERVRDRALATFRVLAEAEGRLHRRPTGQVHFHEVGGIDAIVDVVGTCTALELLGIDEVTASPIAQGIGMTRSAHGAMPNPAPAVVELLRRAGAPTYGLDIPVELTTPTGAALLAALASSFGAMPALRVTANGFGAGGREFAQRPNLTQVVIGARLDERQAGQPVVLLEANVDDVTGETLAHTIGALLEAGAHDAWVTPIVMKKGRPAHTVSALVDPAAVSAVSAAIVRETGTLGVRGSTLERWPQPRITHEVEVEGYPVGTKLAAGRVKVEHDDAARVAKRTGLPLREVVARAEAAARATADDVPGVASITDRRSQVPEPPAPSEPEPPEAG